MPDKRFKSSKTLEAKEYTFWRKWGNYIAVIILGLIAGIILGKTLWDSAHPNKTLLNPLGQTIIPKPEIVQAKEIPYCYDPITCIRDIGEELGEPNSDIMTMIRIARAESNFKPRAKNPKSTASGIFQIIAGTWYSNDCVGDKWDFKDNIKCAWKLHQVRGFQPWDASKSKWGEI